MNTKTNNLAVISEPLAVSELPLRERDFVEAERAICGKSATIFFTITVACCVAIIGAYGISAHLRLPFFSSSILLVPLICLPAASVYYFLFPKWLGSLRFRQHEIGNNQQRDIAFYNDHFEIRASGVNTGSYQYTLIKQIVISENLYIIVLPDMVILPVRHVAIPEERWITIQQHINAVMTCKAATVYSEKKGILEDSIRFTRLMCAGLIVMLCALLLILYLSKGNHESVPVDPQVTEQVYSSMADMQSFERALNAWGKAILISCNPGPDADVGPLMDTSFTYGEADET